jgi:elongation factor G
VSHCMEFDLDLDDLALASTLAHPAVGEGRYIVQTRCPSDVGHVVIRIEPHIGKHHFVLIWSVDEEVIPSEFRFAVAKGIKSAALENGNIVNVKVTVTGGTYHMIDSREKSYEVAARRAFEDAVAKAGIKPIPSVSSKGAT